MKKERLAFIFNVAIFLLEIIGFVIAIAKNGIVILGFYTQLSNLVLLIATGVYLFERIKNKENDISIRAARLKYVATCLVTVTFVVVVFVFVPWCLPQGIDAALYIVFNGASFFHHFICPILAIISYFAFEDDLKPTLIDALIAMLPTLFYAIISTTLNVLKVIEGPYPFLYVYKQPILISVLWFIAIPGFGFLFALLVCKIKNKFRK